MEQTAEQKTDYWYHPSGGGLFFDKKLTKKIYCPNHQKTQLYRDPIDDQIHCPICKRHGFGVNMWRFAAILDEHKNAIRKKAKDLLDSIGE